MARTNQYATNNNKFMPKKRKSDNTIVAKIWVDESTNDGVFNEILDVLKGMNFPKISYPIGAYRRMLDTTLPDDDTRVIGVGYVKKYDPKTGEFVVHLYNNYKETIKEFENPLIEVVFNTYNDELKTITKLNIVEGVIEEAEEDDESYDDITSNAVSNVDTSEDIDSNIETAEIAASVN